MCQTITGLLFYLYQTYVWSTLFPAVSQRPGALAPSLTNLTTN